MTLEQAAKAYADLLETTPNGWGEHVHPVYGKSHVMYRRMAEHFGTDAWEAAVSAEFASRKK